MRYTLMHISDLHAGPPFRPEVAAQVAREAHDLQPDLLVISGDFVQRADRPGEWRTITAFLETLPTPRLTVPGNHDVPMYNVAARLLTPYRAYRKHISPELNPVFELPGLVVVGGNTAHGLTIDGGHLDRPQMKKIEAIFAHYPADTARVMVLHHHVVNPPGSEGRNMISNAEAAVQLLDRAGVELLLNGHIHVSYVGTTLDVRRDLRSGTVICQSGTTTSRRGKGREKGRNSYNIITVTDREIAIEQRMYFGEHGRFRRVADHSFPRAVLERT